MRPAPQPPARLLKRFHRLRPARLRHDQSGLALLETALIMPLVVVFIMIIADLGLLAAGYASANHAIAEGARCGIVGGTDSAVTQRVENGTSFAEITNLTLTPRAGAGAGDDFTVTGTFKHDWFTPFIDGLDFTSYTATSTMRLETDLVSLTECPTVAGSSSEDEPDCDDGDSEDEGSKKGSKKSGKKSGGKSGSGDSCDPDDSCKSKKGGSKKSCKSDKSKKSDKSGKSGKSDKSDKSGSKKSGKS